MNFEDYRRQDAVGLAGLVAGGQVSAGEVLDAAVARMAEVNPKINAVTPGPDRAGAERGGGERAVGRRALPAEGSGGDAGGDADHWRFADVRRGDRVGRQRPDRRLSSRGPVDLRQDQHAGVRPVAGDGIDAAGGLPQSMGPFADAGRIVGRGPRRPWRQGSCRRPTPAMAAARSVRRRPVAGSSE